jgi:hypothetical protein
MDNYNPFKSEPITEQEIKHILDIIDCMSNVADMGWDEESTERMFTGEGNVE